MIGGESLVCERGRRDSIEIVDSKYCKRSDTVGVLN
jgi:hypothetical protein